MMEALRLFPPLIMLLRQAKAPFAVTTSQGKTHVIPKVWPVPQSASPSSVTGNLAAECNALPPAHMLGVCKQHAFILGTLRLIPLCLQLSCYHVMTASHSLDAAVYQTGRLRRC